MELIRVAMAAVVFLLGTAAIIFGFVIILSREYQETLKVLSAQSMRVSAKAITEDGVGPVLAGMSQLLDSVRKLVATAVGVGVFLALLGVGMTALGYWMLTAGS